MGGSSLARLFGRAMCLSFRHFPDVIRENILPPPPNVNTELPRRQGLYAERYSSGRLPPPPRPPRLGRTCSSCGISPTGVTLNVIGKRTHSARKWCHDVLSLPWIFPRTVYLFFCGQQSCHLWYAHYIGSNIPCQYMLEVIRLHQPQGISNPGDYLHAISAAIPERIRACLEKLLLKPTYHGRNGVVT